MSNNGDDWQRPRPGAVGYRRDALIAIVLAVAAWLSWWLYAGAIDQEHAPWWGALIWSAAIAGSLAFRRRYPELVALVVSATFVIGSYTGIYEQLFANICLFLALYSVGAWGRNRLLSTVVRVVIAAGMVLWLVGVLIFQAMTPDSTPDISRDGWLSQLTAIGLIQIVTNLLYFGAAYVFGNASYTAARQREALEQRTLELEREREVSSRQAVALERVRIARELHDVVAHHVSVMGLQAGAARRVLGKGGPGASVDPRAIESLSQIEQNAREAVDELHRMLGALRQSDDANGTTTSSTTGTSGSTTSGSATTITSTSAADDPNPASPAEPTASRSASTRGLDQLGELVAEAQAAGLPVSYTTVGTTKNVSPVVGLSAYRIVQESLTNVRKHGGARATADVRLRYLDSQIEVEVSDTGAGIGASAAGAAAGLGQIGMRERVAAVGGEIAMETKPRGGYRVRARLPLAPAKAPAANEADAADEADAAHAADATPATRAAPAPSDTKSDSP